jgi:hypothetical protein
MFDQSRHLAQVDKELFERVMKMIDQISDQEKHFNNLQAQYRKLASTWLLAAFAACGYILKSAGDLPFDEWYFVFGICMAASAGLCILWVMDLQVYQNLLSAFFKQGVLLELTYYEWLCPFRINIMRSQDTGEVRSKVQYFYFTSVAVLQLLAIIALCNFKIFADRPSSKILYSSVIAIIVLAIEGVLLWKTFQRRRDFKQVKGGHSKELARLIRNWEIKTNSTTDAPGE